MTVSPYDSQTPNQTKKKTFINFFHCHRITKKCDYLYNILCRCKKMSSRLTLSDLSLLQFSIVHLYASQCSSASLLNILSCTSSEELASDNFLQVSRDFWGSDFCHFFTAPTIEGVDDPPVPGSPSNCKRHISRSRKCFNVPLKTKISFLKSTQIFKESERGKEKKKEEDKEDRVIALSCRLVFHYLTWWHMFANLYWWCINYHVIHIYSYSCTWYGSRNCSQRTTSLHIHMPQITKFKPTTHDEECPNDP